MSFILAYNTVFTALGSTQYAFLSVVVRESLLHPPASTSHNREATWEQLSPNPAMQSQCAAKAFPFSSLITQGVSGFSDIRWE